jgi:hypothetical protein
MAWANTEKTPEAYAETEDKPAGCVTSVTLTVDEAVIRDSRRRAIVSELSAGAVTAIGSGSADRLGS